MILPFACFIILLFSCFYIAVRARKTLKPTCLRELLFDGNQASLTVKSNFGSLFSSSLLAALFAFIYQSGWIALLTLSLAFGVGYLILFKITSSKRWEDNKFLSITEFIEHKFGRTFSRCLLIPIFIFMILCVSFEINLFQTLINNIFPHHPLIEPILSFLLLYICCSYVYTGGFLGVLRTDTFQFWLVSLGAIVILISVYISQDLDMSGLLQAMKPSDIPVSRNATWQSQFIRFGTFFFAISFWIPMLPDFWIRNSSITVATAKESEGIKKGIAIRSALLSSIGVLFMGALVAAFKSKLHFDASDDKAFYYFQYLLTNLATSADATNNSGGALHFPYLTAFILRGAVLSFIGFVILTTVDTFLASIAQLSYLHYEKPKKANISQWITILAMFVAILISNSLGEKFYAGWGTAWWALVISFSSILCWTLFFKANLKGKMVISSFFVYCVIMLSTITIGAKFFWLPYIRVNVVFSTIYLLAWPMSIGIVMSFCNLRALMLWFKNLQKKG